jgi:SAM-dependent methyltransferase
MGIWKMVRESGAADRRARILSGFLTRLVPANSRVLDIGCGDGRVAGLLAAQRKDLTVTGVDVIVQSNALIPVTEYDGLHLPYQDRTFDVAILLDVLHHTDDPRLLLAEATRVCGERLVIKDHLCDGWLADTTLRFLDWAGNREYGVRLPYTFWTSAQWREAFAAMGLQVETWESRLGLYPRPFTWFFDRSLHFVSRIRICERTDK